MKKCKTLILFLCIVCLLIMLCSCDEKAKTDQEEVMVKLQKALRDVDVSLMKECFSFDLSGEAFWGAMSQMSGIDNDVPSQAMIFYIAANQYGYWPYWTFKNMKTEEDGDHSSTVTTLVEANDYEFNLLATFVKEEGKWLIQSLDVFE